MCKQQSSHQGPHHFAHHAENLDRGNLFVLFFRWTVALLACSMCERMETHACILAQKTTNSRHTCTQLSYVFVYNLGWFPESHHWNRKWATIPRTCATGFRTIVGVCVCGSVCSACGGCDIATLFLPSLPSFCISLFLSPFPPFSVWNWTSIVVKCCSLLASCAHTLQVVVYMFATWYNPSKFFFPTFAQLCQEFPASRFVNMDIDKQKVLLISH